MTYFIYILKCSDGTLYTGQTQSIESRLEQHQTGKGAKYTRTRLPVKLLWKIRVGSRSLAMKGEHYIKKCLSTSKKRSLANGNNRLLKELLNAIED